MINLHETRRSMRQTRRAALQKGAVALLDIGSSKIACLILRISEERKAANMSGVGPMAGQSSFRVIGAATTRSQGVHFGEVEEMAATERAMRSVLRAAQKMANLRVDHAIVCFAGGSPRSYGLAGEVNIETHIVSESDVADVLAVCDMPDLGAGRGILYAEPVNFVLDNVSGLSDPRGLTGNHLSSDVHLVSVEERVLQNILHCVERCDLALAGFATTSHVSGLSVLVEDEQELGAACIDFGGETTSLSIFMKKQMIYADSFKMGGDHITADISKGLRVPLSVAERIKTKHGGAVATSMDDRDMIDLTDDANSYDNGADPASRDVNTYDAWERERRHVSRAELIGIIRPRLEEILEEAHAHLEAAGFSHLPSRQIVLTGGGSQLPGIDDLASRILGHQIRLGRPLRIQGLPSAATGAGFSALVGLCLYTANPRDEWWSYEPRVGAKSAHSLRRMMKWFKTNW